MTRWFRFYDGALDDPKVQALPGDLFKIWVNLLCVAARSGGRLPQQDLPFLMRMEPAVIDQAIGVLMDRGLIDETEAGLEPHNWNGRQFKSDDSKERVRKHRDRNGEVTVTETIEPKKNETPALCSVSASDRRTLSEKITDEFEICYGAYPLHKGRGAALRAYKTARGKVELDALLSAIKKFASKCAGMDPKFIPHPATWLNQERWLDDDLQPPKPQEPMSNGKVYVKYGTDAGDAWERDYRSRGKVPPRDSRGGYYFPTEWPAENVSVKQSDNEAT